MRNFQSQNEFDNWGREGNREFQEEIRDKVAGLSQVVNQCKCSLVCLLVCVSVRSGDFVLVLGEVCWERLC